MRKKHTSNRNVVEPTLIKDDSTLGQTYTHPAFGQIGASRVNGNATLYDSDFNHQHYVIITLSRSRLTRGLARDWHYAADELFKVAMSEAQWVSFVSAMNVGGGVPCTIERTETEIVPGLPHRDQAHEYRREMPEVLMKAVAELQELKATAKLRRTDMDKIDAAIRKITDSLGWVQEQFDEHMEERVEKAKVEINAYMVSAVQRAGLEALGAVQPLQLEEKDE